MKRASTTGHGPAAALALCLAACSPEPARQPADADAAAAEAGARAAPPAPPPTAAPAAAKTVAPAPADTPKLAVEGEGLRWFLPPNGSARPIPFGTPKAAVLASLERVRGKASEGTNESCGAGPVQYANWADGLSLVFQRGKFAGWGLDGRAAGALSTADGIGPGTTRAQLDQAIGPPLEVRRTTLGIEFTAGALNGILDGPGANARITDMWAGTSCAAR